MKLPPVRFGFLLACFLGLLALSLNFGMENQESFLFYNLRLTRVLTAVAAGGALALAGLLLQTYFQNPLAGPYVLGVNSGATFLTALFIVSSSSNQILLQSMLTDWGMMGISIAGSMITLFIVIFLSRTFKTKSGLIIFGLLFSHITSGLTTVILSYAKDDELRSILFWSFGSFQRTSPEIVFWFMAIVFILAFACLFLAKDLNLMGLGAEYASLSGLNQKRLETIVIAIGGILSGIVLGICGPIAFVGLAAIHLAKIIFKTESHFILIPASFVVGSSLALAAETFLITISPTSIPLNAVLGILSGPIILAFILRPGYKWGQE